MYIDLVNLVAIAILSYVLFLWSTTKSIVSVHDLIQACVRGDVQATKRLLDFFDPSTNDNEAIIAASREGCNEVVELLLTDPRVDPSANDSEALHHASEMGHASVVKPLLADPRVDPSAQNNYAIRIASFYGHTEVVELLLADPRVDPSVNGNYPIRYTSTKGQNKVLKLLMAHPKVSPNAEIVQQTFENANLKVEFFQAATNPALDGLMPLTNIVDGLTLELLDILISRAKGIPSNQKFLHSLRLLKLPIPAKIKLAYMTHLQALFSILSSSDILKLAQIMAYLAEMEIDVSLLRLIAQHF